MKISRFIKKIMILSVMLPVFNISALASVGESLQEIPKDSFTYEITGEHAIQAEDGSYLIFESEEDMNIYISSLNQARACLPGDPGYPTCNGQIPTNQTTTAVGTKTYSRHFMGYNKYTPSWSQASSYAITMGTEQTFSQSLNYDDVMFSVSTQISKGVTINIPANASKWSKLGVRADISATKYKVVTTNANTGAVLSTVYYVTPRVTATYNDVIYQ